ncbi:MAG TPA: hypothetical protein VJT84_12805 [Gaiellaceae bacterium]|nr:hypothetical protein [Gaiellaceae bacterium]
MQSLYGSVQAAFRRGGTEASSLVQLARTVPGLQRTLRDTADELDELRPPPEVDGPNHELAQGLRAYADDLDELRDAALDGNAAGVRTFNHNVRTNPAIDVIEEAAEQMIRRGYDLGPLRPD